MFETVLESDERDDKKRRASPPDDFEHYLASMRHYSDLIFKTRVAIITACVLIFSFIAAFKSESPTCVGNHPHAKIAAAAMIVVALMTYMENNYMKQYCKTIFFGAQFEVRTKRGGFFVHSNIAWKRYLIFYYFTVFALSCLAFAQVLPWTEDFGIVAVSTLAAIAIFSGAFLEMLGDQREYQKNMTMVRDQWYKQVVAHDQNLRDLHGDKPKEK